MIKKIPLPELRAGMYVSGLEKEEPGNVLFFMNNILVRSDVDIERFRNNGYKSVYIEIADESAMIAEDILEVPERREPRSSVLDFPEEPVEDAEAQTPTVPVVIEEPYSGPSTEDAPETEPGKVRAEKVVAFHAHPSEKTRTSEPRPRSFAEELEEARRIRSEAEELTREFLSSVRLGTDIKAWKIHQSVDRMVESLFRNQDALTSLARLKSADDYTFAHSINVCILSLALGRHLGLKKEELNDLGTGAILHDIGKMLVPESILKKPARLTDTEFDEMKKHSAFGSGILLKAKDIKEASRIVVLQHHEKYDGTGYGLRLRGKDIHLYARIAAVADVYDAMTSNRVYQKGIVPEDAMKKMYLLRNTHFEPELVERLIKCLGIYPIGTMIELNTGEIARVKMTNHSHPLQPVITMLLDKDRRPFPLPFDVDLKDEIGRWILNSKDTETFSSVANGFDVKVPT